MVPHVRYTHVTYIMTRWLKSPYPPVTVARPTDGGFRLVASVVVVCQNDEVVSTTRFKHDLLRVMHATTEDTHHIVDTGLFQSPHVSSPFDDHNTSRTKDVTTSVPVVIEGVLIIEVFAGSPLAITHHTLVMSGAGS